MLEKVNPSSLETAGVPKAVNHVEANAKRPSSFILLMEKIEEEGKPVIRILNRSERKVNVHKLYNEGGSFTWVIWVFS